MFIELLDGCCVNIMRLDVCEWKRKRKEHTQREGESDSGYVCVYVR